MKNKLVWSVFLLILSAFVSISLCAQDQNSVRGQLGGVVQDPTGAVIQGASITITGPTGSDTRMSDEKGEFTFPALIPGFYDVKVTKDGFKGTTVQKVEVGINKTSTIKVSLELGAVTQTVEVVASAVSVESQSTAVTTDIADTTYDNLPLGRSITSVFYVSPGVVSGLGTGAMNPAISGGTGLENAYIADGVLLNDPAFGGLGVYHRRYGGIGVGINASFVKEVQVETAAFGAQYGHSTGGVVNMVTKSGGTQYHGVVGGYFQSKGMSAPYQNQDNFQVNNLIGKEIAPQAYEGDFELGGYVPVGALKNHLFFFGAFNPTWNAQFVEPVPGTGLYTVNDGVVDRKDTVWDYSAKLSYQINANNSIEGSVFGDPTHSDLAPWSTLNINNNSANTTQTFGSRNLAVRYSGIIGSSLVIDGAFTMNWNNFNELPLPIVNITDDTQIAGLPGQAGSFRAQGFGSFETYDSNTKGIQFDVHKVVTIFGEQHTFSVGYSWAFPTYDDNLGYSGGLFPIDTTNVSGDPYFGTNTSALTGQSEQVHLLLELAPLGCTLCPYMNLPNGTLNANGTPQLSPQQVVLLQDRGQFSGFTSVSTAKNHAAYANDDWEMSKYATLSLGLRWEQQRMSSGGVSQVINDQWDPRIGFTVDPKGDRKSKIYANFGRYAWIMPLDAAVRELNVQNETENIYYAPDTPNCHGGTCTTQSTPATPTTPAIVNANDMVTLNNYNTVEFDPKNVLNSATNGVAVNPTVLLISGEGATSPFQPGVRMEYNDEYVVGAEHEFRGGVTLSARYINRGLKRLMEDFTGVSIEQSLAGVAGAYFIGNPNSNTNVTINPNPLVFSQDVDYTSSTLPAGCYDSNGFPTPHVALNVQNSMQAAATTSTTYGGNLGSVCYPSVNDPTTWSIPNPNCGTGTGHTCGTPGYPAFVVKPGALFGGEPMPDPSGKGNGYINPMREYQAVEIEINKSFSHNWSLISNWRISSLDGNYEGAYRNDNGQNDPGISSLYDFTPGVLGTLADQFASGPLNADRHHVVNIYPTYTFDKGFIKGLVVTPGIKIQTGVPLTTFTAQEAYQDAGEVPQYGRGDLGFSPTTGTVDVHVDYPWKISETKSVHFAVDMLNIADTRREIQVNQDWDLEFGVKNLGFGLPGTSFGNAAGTQLVQGFVQPFSVRFHVAFNF